MHPGLTSPVLALAVNLVMTVGWMVAQLGVGWSALSHSRTGQKVGSLVQYITNPLGAKVGYLYQCVYLLFWVGNTLAGVAGAIMAERDKADGADTALLTQCLWLVIGVAVGWWAGGRPRTERN